MRREQQRGEGETGREGELSIMRQPHGRRDPRGRDAIEKLLVWFGLWVTGPDELASSPNPAR
jgi:hypothetical protein